MGRTRPRHGRWQGFDHGDPISRIDSLPILIFMTVLAVVLYSLQKPPSHALLIDLPNLLLAPQGAPPGDKVNLLTIDAAGQVRINQSEIDDSSLPRVLLSMRGEAPSAQLRFDPDANTPYPRVLAVLVEIKRAGLADGAFCFAGLERYRQFDKPWRNTPQFLTLLPPEPVPPPLDRPAVPPCDPIASTAS